MAPKSSQENDEFGSVIVMSSQRDALNVSHEGRRQMYPSRPLPSGPCSCLRHTHRLWFAQESKHEGSLFPVPFKFTHSCKHIAQCHCQLFLFTASCVVVFFFLIHHYRVFLIVFVLLLLLNHSASPKTNPGHDVNHCVMGLLSHWRQNWNRNHLLMSSVKSVK